MSVRECIVCGAVSMHPEALLCYEHSEMIRVAQFGGSNGKHLIHNVLRATQTLLQCNNDHEHVVGVLQEHLVGTPCRWCGEEMFVALRGWR